MRNLKALGLALIAVFALSAMTASAASAQTRGMITADNPFYLHGEDQPGEPGTNALTAFGGRTECSKVTYTGGKPEATPSPGDHEPLSTGASDFTLTPHYEECKSASGLPETVTMNGCDYDIHIGETIPAEDPLYAVTADLNCPPEKEVTIDIYGNATAHAAGVVLCTIHIPPKENIPGGTLTDEGNGHLTLGGVFTPFPVTLTGPSACAEKTVTDPNAKLDIAVTLTGRTGDTGGSPIPLKLSD